MPKTYNEKCTEFESLRQQLAAIQDSGDANEGILSDEQQQQFNSLATQAKALKAEILAADDATKRKQLVDELNATANDPRRIPSRNDPETELRQNRLDFSRGRYSLRNFSNGDNAGHERAYHAGLLMLATCGQGAMQQWALERCSNRNLDVRKLSPFQSEDGNSTGGYLVFPEFEATLINLKEQYGVFQREAFRLPMTSDTLIIPRRAGGTTVYYPGENSQLTESAMKFDQLQLVAKKYAQMTRWSTELNEDSVISMADLLSGEMAYQFAKAEDTNGFNGDGTSTYAGTVGLVYKLINTVGGVAPTASVVGAAAGHTSLAAMTLADWNKVIGTLPIYAEGRAKWFMSKSVFYQGPAALIEAAGGNIAMYLSSGVPPKFIGYDVVFTQAMTAAASLSGASATATVSVPAVLGDLSMTGYMGTRRGVTVRTSDQRYIEFDQIAIQCTQRVAINNSVGDSVAPTTVAGPMVAAQIPSA